MCQKNGANGSGEREFATFRNEIPDHHSLPDGVCLCIQTHRTLFSCYFIQCISLPHFVRSLFFCNLHAVLDINSFFFLLLCCRSPCVSGIKRKVIWMWKRGTNIEKTLKIIWCNGKYLRSDTIYRRTQFGFLMRVSWVPLHGRTASEETNANKINGDVNGAFMSMQSQ